MERFQKELLCLVFVCVCVCAITHTTPALFSHLVAFTLARRAPVGECDREN